MISQYVQQAAQHTRTNHNIKAFTLTYPITCEPVNTIITNIKIEIPSNVDNVEFDGNLLCMVEQFQPYRLLRLAIATKHGRKVHDRLQVTRGWLVYRTLVYIIAITLDPQCIYRQYRSDQLKSVILGQMGEKLRVIQNCMKGKDRQTDLHTFQLLESSLPGLFKIFL